MADKSIHFILYAINMKKLIIYSTPTCMRCKIIKDVLTRKNVEFEERDAIENYDEIKDSWLASAPVVFYDNQFFNWENFMDYAKKTGLI